MLTKNIGSTENKINEAIEIEYKGQLGFFIPPDMFLLFDRLLTENPILKQENEEYADWIEKKNELFKLAVDDYFKLKKLLSICIGFSIGSGFVVFGVLAGIIVYAVLNYYKIN